MCACDHAVYVLVPKHNAAVEHEKGFKKPLAKQKSFVEKRNLRFVQTRKESIDDGAAGAHKNLDLENEPVIASIVFLLTLTHFFVERISFHPAIRPLATLLAYWLAMGSAGASQVALATGLKFYPGIAETKVVELRKTHVRWELTI